MSHLPIINRYLIAALLLVAAPLTVAVIFSLIRGHGVARRVLQPHFAVQCYLQAPALLGVMPIAVGSCSPRMPRRSNTSGAPCSSPDSGVSPCSGC